MIEKIAYSGNALLEHVKDREFLWKRSLISSLQRKEAYGHKSKFIIITSNRKENENVTQNIGREVGKKLIKMRYKAYYLRVSSPLGEFVSDNISVYNGRVEHIRQIGELARIFTDAGQIFIISIFNLTDYELEKLRLLNHPNEILIINTEETPFSSFQLDKFIDVDGAVDTVCNLLKNRE